MPIPQYANTAELKKIETLACAKDNMSMIAVSLNVSFCLIIQKPITAIKRGSQ